MKGTWSPHYLPSRLFCECFDNFGRYVQEEDGRYESQRQNDDDEWVTLEACSDLKVTHFESCATYTRSPGESSLLYNLSMVPDEPPAPAARVEFGFVT